ncbi:MAG: hypothetical protein MUO28_08150 [Desulfobacterales bacterium]|nr:hypothetical protein [Desulfobacterales bacterium]
MICFKYCPISTTIQHQLLEKLIKDVMQYVGKVEQHDDLTAVVVRVE